MSAVFWAKVERRGDNECWPWLGYKKKSGHGLTTLKSLPIHAHRKAWVLTHGPIRGRLCVNHRCDNAACCNPAHMYLGTRADNMIDRWLGPLPNERIARGRTFVLTDVQIEQLWAMRCAEPPVTLKECAAHFHVHVATICRYITERRRESIRKLREARVSRLSHNANQ